MKTICFEVMDGLYRLGYRAEPANPKLFDEIKSTIPKGVATIIVDVVNSGDLSKLRSIAEGEEAYEKIRREFFTSENKPRWFDLQIDYPPDFSSYQLVASDEIAGFLKLSFKGRDGNWFDVIFFLNIDDALFKKMGDKGKFCGIYRSKVDLFFLFFSLQFPCYN